MSQIKIYNHLLDSCSAVEEAPTLVEEGGAGIIRGDLRRRGRRRKRKRKEEEEEEEAQSEDSCLSFLV